MPLDREFLPDPSALARALELLLAAGRAVPGGKSPAVPASLPERGVGSSVALERLAPRVLGGAARLGAPEALAHMDPPTPWVAWAATLWNAALNQNLLHPATAPVAREIEVEVLAWLSPFFGMDGGHLVPGATLANLTALWAARESGGAREVVASESAHLSVAKAAGLLGLRFRALPVDRVGALREEALPDDLSGSILVLTAGTTASGAIDPLALAGRARWTHVDAAWAGPLRLTRHAARLDGIERADSVAVSAHKWLFQPKESALVLFRDAAAAHAAISVGGAYLAAPNVGLLGSHGAAAVPLMATLLAWGREGLAARVERCVGIAERLAAALEGDPRVALLAAPRSAVVLWRPCAGDRFDATAAALPEGVASSALVAGERWFRHVAANPNADVERVIAAVRDALDGAGEAAR